MKAKRSIILTGMPGSGKSECGRALAEAISSGIFFDTDAIIESVTSTTISKLFEEKGESFFRSLENQLVDKMVEFSEPSKAREKEKDGSETIGETLESKLDKALTPLFESISAGQLPIVSTGGGLPIERDNMERLKRIGWTVFLDCKLETLTERLEGDQARPLLKQNAESDEAPSSPDNTAQTNWAANNERIKLITALLREREPIYRTADITIDTSFHSPQTLANLLDLKFSELTSSEDFEETV